MSVQRVRVVECLGNNAEHVGLAGEIETNSNPPVAHVGICLADGFMVRLPLPEYLCVAARVEYISHGN